MKPEQHTDLQLPLTDDAQRKLYLIHHMHHFSFNKDVSHELHRCLLYEKKDLKGTKYSISHKISKGNLTHVLDVNMTGKLYDHDNNEFSVINGIISL